MNELVVDVSQATASAATTGPACMYVEVFILPDICYSKQCESSSIFNLMWI